MLLQRCRKSWMPRWSGVRVRLLGHEPRWEHGLLAVGLVIWSLALLVVGAIGGAYDQVPKIRALEQTNAELMETNANLWFLFRDRHCALVSCQITVVQHIWDDYPIAESPAIECSWLQSPSPPWLRAALEPGEARLDTSGSTTLRPADSGRN